MPGVRIGTNSIVGAASLVKNDIPPNSVAAGVPARVVSSIGEYKEKELAQSLNIKMLPERKKREFLLKHFHLT
jgi:serine acetyltransferase